MNTKTAQAIQMMRDGKVSNALMIFKTFRIGFNKKERRTIQIASESMNGMASFYTSIGYDVEKFKSEAISIVNRKYKI